MVDQLVELKLIPQLLVAMKGTTTKGVSEIYGAVNCLWHILLVEEGKYKHLALEEPGLLDSM